MGKRKDGEKPLAGPEDDDKQSVELELRLAGDAEVLKKVFASSFMGGDDDASGKTRDLENRYFDTADRKLEAKGLALRVRSDGSGFRQTLKAGDNAKAALLKRGEWEMPLVDDQIKPDAFPKEAKRLLPKAARKGELQTAFTTWVRRQTRQVTLNGQGTKTSLVEAALDLGEIDTGGKRLPIAEIELELVEGTPEDLYRLALDLQDIGPLHLETRSKSARAFDHLAERPPSWHRGEMPALDRAATVDDAMTLIFESCYAQWLANHAAAFDGRDPEGVHQMRVALRRLRSAFSIFRNLIPASQVDWLRAGAKATINGLGPARDWDVFQSDLLAPLLAARPDDPDLAALSARAKTKGRASYRAARKMLQSPDYTRFALCFGRWLEQRVWRESDEAKQEALRARPIARFARHLLNKRHKRALAGGHNLAELPVEERHKLRITLKKLRYAIEFFDTLFDKAAVKPFLASVKGLQDDFGHLNDVAVAETLLDTLLARPGKQDLRRSVGMVIGWHASGVDAAEPSLLKHWQNFKTTPAFWL